MNLIIYNIFVLIVLIVSSIWIFRRLSSWNVLDRVLACTLPLLIFISANAVLISILKCPTNEWCHNRLAPAFALVHGYRFFNDLESGPVLTWMYGPMTLIAYLPATLLHSPTSAIAFAVLVGTLFFFAPILVLSFVRPNSEKPKDSREIVFSLLIFFGAVFLVVTRYDNLAAAAFMIHSDAPSLGIAGAACAIIYFQRTSRSVAWLFLSASLAVLSIWTKQNLLPLPIALLTYVFIADGYKAFKHYLYGFLLSGTVISSVFILWFGYKYLHFTMLEWPASWPWAADSLGLIPGKYESLGERITVLVAAASELIRYSLPLVVIILTYGVYQLKQTQYTGLGEYLNRNRWSLFVIVSIYTFPIAVLSRVKLGGGTYSLAVLLYFLLCAVVAIAASVSTSSTEDYRQSHQTKAIELLSLLVITFLTVGLFKTQYNPTTTPRLIAEFLNNPVEQAYQYDKEHPGQIYFPDIPLAAIMAQGKLYHSSLGLFDRRFYESVNYDLSSGLIDRKLIDKFAVKNERFQENIPSNFEFVAFPEERKMNIIVMNYLPEFSQKVTINDLPGWIVYAKK